MCVTGWVLVGLGRWLGSHFPLFVPRVSVLEHYGIDPPVFCFQCSFLRQGFSHPILSALSFFVSLPFQHPLTQALL
jgi:hypothetical protein